MMLKEDKATFLGIIPFIVVRLLYYFVLKLNGIHPESKAAVPV